MRALCARLAFFSWAVVQAFCQPGGGTVEVTTLFNLYGPQVEPFTDDKQNAVKAAIVQAAGHGVTLDQVSLSVIGTYTDQSGRRLQAAAKLQEPGVALQAVTQTTQPNAGVVSSAITSAISNGNIVNVYKSSGKQDATSASVVNSNSGHNSGNNSGGSSGSSTPPSDAATNNTNSSPGSKKGFPVWAAALVAVLVVLVVAVIASYFIWRKCAARREIRGQEQLHGSSFPHTTPNGKPSLVRLQPGSGEAYNGASWSPPASSPLDGFKGPMGVPVTTSGGPGRVKPPGRPSWACALSPNFKLQDSIDEERPMDNPMLGFSSTSSSVPAGASAPASEAYMPYEPSRSGRLMNYMRGT